jgi:hypothetical protein
MMKNKMCSLDFFLFSGKAFRKKSEKNAGLLLRLGGSRASLVLRLKVAKKQPLEQAVFLQNNARFMGLTNTCTGGLGAHFTVYQFDQIHLLAVTF